MMMMDIIITRIRTMEGKLNALPIMDMDTAQQQQQRRKRKKNIIITRIRTMEGKLNVLMTTSRRRKRRNILTRTEVNRALKIIAKKKTMDITVIHTITMAMAMVRKRRRKNL